MANRSSLEGQVHSTYIRERTRELDSQEDSIEDGAHLLSPEDVVRSVHTGWGYRTLCLLWHEGGAVSIERCPYQGHWGRPGEVESGAG